MKKWIFLSCITSCFFLSSSAFAVTCPPIVGCKTTAEASTIAGSNADQELITFTQSITSTSSEVALAITDMASANSASLQEGVQSIISSQSELSQIELNQKMKVMTAMSDREMSHEAELAESEHRTNISILSNNDTKEEYQLISDTLTQYSTLSVPEIILILTETYDDNEDGKIPIPIKEAEAVCGESNVQELGKCSRLVRVKPGLKLTAMFRSCSEGKRVLVTRAKEQESRASAVSMVNEKTAQALSNTNPSGAVMQRMQKQLSLSCSPTQFKNRQCATDITAEEYQELIVVGGIIPNGDVSAANFSNPSYSSAEGYMDDLSDDTRDDLKSMSLDRDALNDDPNQKVVPFVYTYKNANQVKSAMSFVDNLVADDLVPALTPNERKQVKYSEYQSRFMSRVAGMSAVRMVLSDSLNSRVGEKMRELISTDVMENTDKFEVTLEDNTYKESVLGASPLDVLVERVNAQSANLQMPLQNGSSSNSGNSFISSPTPGGALDKVFESVVLQNEMILKEILMTEQMIALDAIALGQKSNSQDMVSLMENLRRKGGN